MEVVSPANPGSAETLMHKNRLQEYAQRSSLPLPVYLTINEGFPHAPQFRSTVLVDGVTFRSSKTFAHRKEAEQEVAKMALEGISKKIKQEGCPLIHADTMFCKSILHEYVVKMNLDKPTYTSSKSEGPLPEFLSNVLLDGKIYKGTTGRNKKRAEQLAARTAIESILGSCDASAGTLMSQIIKSKGKLYAAIHQVNVSGILPGVNASSGGGSDSLFVGKEAPGILPGVNASSGGGSDSLFVGKEAQVASTTEISPVAVHGEICTSAQLSEGKQQKEECTVELSSGLIGSGTELQPQSQGGPPLEQVSTCSQIVPGGLYLRFLGQVTNGTSARGPSGFSNETHRTQSNRKRKRSKKGKKK